MAVTTTLYITDNSIRLMVTRGRKISKLAEAPLDLDLEDENVQNREDEIVAKIKQLLSVNKVDSKKVIVGFSGLHCLSRPAILPQLPKAMLDEAVVREARRVLPVPLEQLYLSWQICTEKDGKMQAFMVAVPRQIADNLLRILHKVGLKPYLMDIKPLALARLAKEATAIIVDIQANEFDIVVMSEGVPQPIRTVPFPQEELSLPEKLVLVKDELQRTIQFYNSNNPENPISNDITLYVSGEADEPESYESLADDMGFRVEPLASPIKCPKHLDPIHYLVNIGLAVKEFPKEAGPLLPNLNTLPPEYLPKQMSIARIIAVPSAAVAVGLIVLFVLNIQNADASIQSINSQVDNANFILDQRQEQKKVLSESIASLEKQLASTESSQKIFSGVLGGIVKQGDLINGNLETVVDNLVTGVELTGISHTAGLVSVSGLAPGEEEVLEYSRNLEASGRFSEVVITRISLAGELSKEQGTEEEQIEEEEFPEEESVTSGVSFSLALHLEEMKK